MLLPAWRKRLDDAAAEGRDLKIQTRGKKVVLVAIKPGLNQMDLMEFSSMNDFVKHSDEIEEFFESRRKD